jgi:hypothetical protein
MALRRSPPSYRQAAAAAAATSSTGVNVELTNFMTLPTAGDGTDEVETPAVELALGLGQRILGIALRQKHPLLLIVHASLVMIFLMALTIWTAEANRASGYSQGCPVCAGGWGENVWANATYAVPPCKDVKDNSPGLWTLTRAEMYRTVRKAVRETFVNHSGNDTSVFMVLVEALTAYQLQRDLAGDAGKK